jgi:hypothetical protein
MSATCLLLLRMRAHAPQVTALFDLWNARLAEGERSALCRLVCSLVKLPPCVGKPTTPSYIHVRPIAVLCAHTCAGVPSKVTELYSPTAVLLATLSNEPRTSHDAITD